MEHLSRILDFLPSPYAIASDSLISRTLATVAAELEAFDEDLDRMRQTHWIRFCYRMLDAQKLAALMGIEALPWENLPLFRERLIATVVARLNGAVGPNEIKEFVYDYLTRAEAVTGASLVPGLQTVPLENSYKEDAARPLFRPLRFTENPKLRRESATLAVRGGNVPYLFRWEDTNRGLDESIARIYIAGAIGRKTVTPFLANLTTGDMIGFKNRIGFGRTLAITASGADPENPRLAQALLDGVDVTASLVSMEGFQLGVPFRTDQLAAKPLVPRVARGANEWIFLSIGHYDVRGLDRFFNALADDELREGVFNQTTLDHSLFPSGTLAKVAMDWEETQPASFEVGVPRYVVLEPAESELHNQAAEGLQATLKDLRAAGVLSTLRFLPFSETQQQAVRATLPWVVLDPEKGSAGEQAEVALGAQFDESPLGNTRFE